MTVTNKDNYGSIDRKVDYLPDSFKNTTVCNVLASGDCQQVGSALSVHLENGEVKMWIP
jgi:hypothetical protein